MEEMQSQMVNRRRSSSRSLDVSSYKREDGLTTVQQLARLADWLAKVHPYAWCPWNLGLKAVTGRHSTPTLNNKEVVALRGTSSRAREILMVRYGRDLRVDASMGFRATVNSTDLGEQSLPGAVRRLNRQREKVIAVHDLIDPMEIKNRTVRDFVDQTGGLVKTLKSRDFTGRLQIPDLRGPLLPPVKPDKK